MPFINTKTNVKISDEQRESLKKEFGQAIALIPGKSEGWLMLNFEDEQKMYFKGIDSNPLAMVDVSIYGNASSDSLNNFTDKISSVINKILNIEKDKIYIKYSLVENWGWNGNNF